MRRITMALAAVVAGGMIAGDALAESGWSGRRAISFQRPNDLFYNYYVGPEPSGTAAEMYVSPLPVPERVGHTYNTYQPLLPHEQLHAHKRSWWTYRQGSGWRRTKARYGNFGYFMQAKRYSLGMGEFSTLPAKFQ